MSTRPALLLIVLLLSCTSSPNGPAYDPELPGAWAATVDNRFFPLVPGSRWRYQAETDEGAETIIVEEVEDGRAVSTEGSWEWGVDGALPGIIMWADPAAYVGVEYRQEFYEGEAEDWGRVVALDQTVTVPLGTFTGCIQTEDWNGLEAGSLEHKFYCPQTGVTLEVAVQGGGERVELVERS